MTQCVRIRSNRPHGLVNLHPRSLLEIAIGRQQVVPQCDRWRVAEPSGDDVDWELLRELRFTAGSQGVEEFGPGLETGAFDDLLERRS